jgi:hypothetical protein
LVKLLRHKLQGRWTSLAVAAAESKLSAQSILWVAATSVGKRGKRLEIRECGLQSLEIRAVPK